MKPSWDDAPEWANYLAMDADGEWKWFENEPGMARDGFVNNFGEYGYACDSDPGEIEWDESLESRP